MSYLFKSQLYRTEALRWLVIGVLAMWALTASAFAILKKDKVIVIGVSDDASYIIQVSNIKREQRELLGFSKAILTKLYSFDEKSYPAQITQVSDLFSDELWNEKKSEYQQITDKLKADPLIQKMEIVSIDEVSPSQLIADLKLTITHKLQVRDVRVKVSFEVKKRDRTELNPWMYELVSLKDAAL